MKRWNKNDLRVFGPHDGASWISRHPERVFNTGQPNPYEMVAAVIETALILAQPQHKVQITRFQDWWIVQSDFDWIANDSQYSVETVFKGIVPFPEGGTNATRGEVILTAFAQDVVTVGGSEHLLIKGEVLETNPIWETLEVNEMKRSVAFRMPTHPAADAD